MNEQRVPDPPVRVRIGKVRVGLSINATALLSLEMKRPGDYWSLDILPKDSCLRAGQTVSTDRGGLWIRSFGFAELTRIRRPLA